MKELALRRRFISNCGFDPPSASTLVSELPSIKTFSTIKESSDHSNRSSMVNFPLHTQADTHLKLLAKGNQLKKAMKAQKQEKHGSYMDHNPAMKHLIETG